MDFLVSKIYEFFKKQDKSLDDFLKTLPNYISHTDDGKFEKFDYSLALHISQLCKYLKKEGLLMQVKSNPSICICDKYISVGDVNFLDSYGLLSDV